MNIPKEELDSLWTKKIRKGSHKVVSEGVTEIVGNWFLEEV